MRYFRGTFGFVWTIAFLVILAIQPGFAQNQAPPKLWDYRFGGSDSEELSQMVITANGDVVVAGITYSPTNGDITQPAYFYMGRQTPDIWVVRTTAAGIKLWDRRLGGISGAGSPPSVVPTADGGVLIATTIEGGAGRNVTQPSPFFNTLGTDLWVVKLDAAGTKLWDRRYGGDAADDLTTAVATRDGGLLVLAATNSSISGEVSQGARSTSGASDVWVLRLNANGTKRWDRRLGSGNATTITARGITETLDGGVALLANVAPIAAGDVTAPARTPTQGFNTWLAKLDRNGLPQWNRRYGTPSGNQVVIELAQAPDLGYLLVLEISDSGPNIGLDKTSAGIGAGDAWVMRVDSLGVRQWDAVYGGVNGDGLSSIIPAQNGWVLGGGSLSGISGTRSQPSRGQADGWLVRINDAGQVLWDKALGGPVNDAVWGIARTASGNLLAALRSNSGIGGDKTQASRGLDDYWLVGLGAEVLQTTAPAWASSLSLYPNPSTGTVCQLTLPAWPGGSATAKLHLFDALGRLVWAGSAPLTAQGSTVPLPLPALAAGIYLLRVGLADEWVTLRLTITP